MCQSVFNDWTISVKLKRTEIFKSKQFSLNFQRTKMSNFYSSYDVAVVGGGHAGVEAALSCARMGLQTILITQTID